PEPPSASPSTPGRGAETGSVASRGSPKSSRILQAALSVRYTCRRSRASPDEFLFALESPDVATQRFRETPVQARLIKPAAPAAFIPRPEYQRGARSHRPHEGRRNLHFMEHFKKISSWLQTRRPCHHSNSCGGPDN